ncbi:unnamed protein product [Closterium sp. NIES-64]|nr:unnamed protein product [Closterium sp. NIES-64]
MPRLSALYSCEWCRRRFRARNALFSHKRRKEACIIRASRFLTSTAGYGAAAGGAAGDPDPTQLTDDEMPELNSDDEVEVRDDDTAQDTDDEDVESDEEENASSNEEGDAAAVLDDNDSAPEGTFRPCENFDTLMEVFRFIVGCNNGAGLSNESTVWLLNLLRDERLDLELIRHWCTLYAVIRFGMSLLMSQRQYDTITFTIPGWEGEFQVIRANGREVSFHVAGRHRVAGNTSDATILSGNERTRVWAVYLSIANIPLRRRWMDCGKLLLAMLPFPPATMTPAQKVELFQAAMKIVLADLVVASHVRMKKMYPDARLAGLRSPGSGSYWASGANFTASEHASAMMVHLLTHVPNGVRRGGLPPEFSAAVYENAHIRTCKLPYRTSNHRQPLQAIAAHNVRASAMGQLTSALPARRRNQTALTQAIATDTPQLTLARRSLTARPDHESSAASVFDDVNIPVGGLLFHYDTVMRNAGLRPFPAGAHTAVAVPAFPTDYGHIRPHYVRAAASLHGHTAFSCVEYLSSAGRTAYGRLILLLDAERPLDDSSYEPAEVAVLQRLNQ